jgi:uncharacterized protein YlaI
MIDRKAEPRERMLLSKRLRNKAKKFYLFELKQFEKFL